jgi:RND family efflux transporter MFP subunit
MFSQIRDSRFLMPGLIVSVGILISLVLYFSTPEPVQTKKTESIILVDALEVKKVNFTMKVHTQGEVRAKTRTSLISEVSGVITEIAPGYVTGGAFKKDQILIKIDERNYISSVKKAKASIASARLKLAEQEGLAEFALLDWHRANKNKSRTPSDLALRKPQILEAKTNLEFAIADLAKKEGDLERTSVKAFYNGVVESKEADIGQYVSIGTKLGIVLSIDYVEVRLPIPLHEIEFLNLPEALDETVKQVNVKFSSITGHKDISWQGLITRTEAVMDRKNRVLYAVAIVTDPYKTGDSGWTTPLRVGAFVNAEIEGRPFEDLILIPRAAIRPGNKVWTIDKDSRLEMRTIKPLRADEKFLYVNEGLEDGDLLSITPLENPLPGTKVKYRLITANKLLED